MHLKSFKPRILRWRTVIAGYSAAQRKKVKCAHMLQFAFSAAKIKTPGRLIALKTLWNYTTCLPHLAFSEIFSDPPVGIQSPA